jgi:dihydroneopterin aldolase
MRISLNNLNFHGYHGIFEEEKKLGNQFKVTIHIDFTPLVEKFEFLEQTIDYVSVYSIIKDSMNTPTPLLETLVCLIADKVLKQHPIAEKVFVEITKLKLPIPFYDGETSVSIEKKRG